VNLQIRLKKGSWFRDIYQDTPQASLPADLHAPHDGKAPLSFIEKNLVQLASGTPELKIGRHLENGLVLDDLNVSRFHALITRSPDSHWFLKDLDSHNGTYLKRQSKITLCSSAGIQLQDGDRLILGGAVLEIQLRPNPPK
jgi:pSer/pThr/pTyr-binding forkhead associated (FHA) protein